ncbi:hypothetical protein N1851_025858 [Merluccius polli]|uniref:Uncharacterized protein n=1 Tax=Merluccius polli TaxID=89951 RepID=A0AA47MD35_MERPO|nr:hypothetical protein N1851_025858 [Merluccius polli]
MRHPANLQESPDVPLSVLRRNPCSEEALDLLFMDCLASIGVGVYQWFASYLADRTHFVQIQNYRSKSSSVCLYPHCLSPCTDMDDKQLKCNSSKTELHLIGSKYTLSKTNICLLPVAEATMSPHR